MKLENALRALNGLVEQGFDYPEALSLVCYAEKLGEEDSKLLAEAYDTQED